MRRIVSEIRWLQVSVLVTLTGCSFNGNGSVGGEPDATPGCIDWAPLFVDDPCTLGAPEIALSLAKSGEYLLDTDSGDLTDPDAITVTHLLADMGAGRRAVFVAGLLINSDSTLRADGGAPLIVISESTMIINGNIDVSSARATGAAGANPSACPSLATGEDDSGGGGGGGGGGLGGAGGDGGDADANDSNGSGSGSGAPGGPQAMASTPRGGCGGSAGGGGASGGPGGGVVLLISRESIHISRSIDAGGGGGGGGSVNDGGGGGGSGGYIGLSAEGITVTPNTSLTANGGGGGGGGSGGGAGQDGDDAQPSLAVASGGSAAASASDGGDGSTGQTVDGEDVGGRPDAGGGGGGGGAGYIVIFANSLPTFDAAIVSPPARLESP